MLGHDEPVAVFGLRGAGAEADHAQQLPALRWYFEMRRADGGAGGRLEEFALTVLAPAVELGVGTPWLGGLVVKPDRYLIAVGRDMRGGRRDGDLGSTGGAASCHTAQDQGQQIAKVTGSGHAQNAMVVMRALPAGIGPASALASWPVLVTAGASLLLGGSAIAIGVPLEQLARGGA